MALAERPLPVFQRGRWPGALTLRRGWARAEARPWNDAVPDATLRLVRGGSGFLTACTRKLQDLGAPTVMTPPLPASARRVWVNAGYEEFLPLALMRLDLARPVGPPNHLVIESEPADIDGLLRIDRSAFPEFWRFDRYGIAEAIAATSDTAVYIIRDSEGSPAAYAVVGNGHAISYLQRVAVHTSWQGQGMGRSLVRVAARNARASGAKAMLLNTQFDNESAIGLYESEGYVLLPEPLAVLRRN